MKPEHLKLLADKDWRLNNLYWITDKEGKPTRFRMTPEQREYFEGIHTRNIILKARQLGFTTEVCIIQLDAALFESAKCALIAHTLNDAKRLFREKVKYAYDKLPTEIKAANPASNDSSGELVFKKGGSLYVSTSFRGGTLRYLHVSEFGKICAKYPDKAREIVTGAFEAVSTGCFATIESTAEGRAGYFFDYCQTAEKALLQGKTLSALDWKFFFFSWWKNPQYAIDPVESLPVRLIEYFAEMEAKHGVVINDRQKAWYYAKEKTLGDDMKREYPNSLEFDRYYRAYERNAVAFAAVHKLLDSCWVDNPTIIDGDDGKESTETTDWEKSATKLLKKHWPKIKDADRRNLVGRYITGRAGNDFDTSEPITFTGSMYVLVTDSLGNPTLRYPATARADTKYGFTAAIPNIQLNIWNGDTVQLPSRYLIATVEELDSQLWKVSSIKPNTDNTVSLTVAEYSDAIYQ